MTTLEATRESGADRGTLRALAGAIGPNFTVAILFVLTLFVVVLTYGGSIRWKEGPILISGGIVVGLLTIRTVWWLPSVLRGEPHAMDRLRQALVRVLYDWGPLVIVMWMFESLEPYTGVIRKTVVDQQLYDIDVRLFGIEPSVWISRFQHPLLTDWMSIAYGLYFIVPMVLATTLSLRGRRTDFNEMVSGCVIQMGLGFIIHLFIPAGPPRHFAPLVNGIFDPPHLHSWTGLMELQQGAFDTHDPMRTHSSFPSLHCSFGMLTLLYAHRFGARAMPKHPKVPQRVVTVLVVSLWISTVYLRHHWVPDCIAGMILGAFSVWAARRIRGLWPATISPVDPT